MKLLQLIYEKLTEDEVRGLQFDILVELQREFILDEKLQAELLGRVVKKDEEFVLMYECTRDGVMHGRFTKKEGERIAETAEYKDGKKHGPCMAWNDSGGKKSLRHYENGKEMGESTYWWSNGQIMHRGITNDGNWVVNKN